MMGLGNNLCCEFRKHHICFRLEDISFLYEYLYIGFTSLDHFVTMILTCICMIVFSWQPDLSIPFVM